MREEPRRCSSRSSRPPPDDRGAPLGWTMSFVYDAVNDVVTASFTDVVLVNSADVLRWQREVEAQFARFGGRKVDLLIDLAGLVVKPGASRTFGKSRAMVLSKYTTRSYRFNGDAQTRTSVFTSSVIE